MIPNWIEKLTDLDLIAEIEKIDYDPNTLSRQGKSFVRSYKSELKDMGFLTMTDADKADLTGAPGELLGDFRTIFERLLFEVS